MAKKNNLTELDFDIIVAGGGPAGCCAAIRLAALGYRVALIEARKEPVFNPGEMLTPGIRQIMTSLRALDLLDDDENISQLNSILIWETENPVVRHLTDHLIVNRRRFDLALQKLAGKQGVVCFCPARFLEAEQSYSNGVRVKIYNGKPQYLKCKFLIDARSQRGGNFPLARPQIALWGEYSFSNIHDSTIVEVCKLGWIWASKVTDGRFRIMLFTDTALAKQYGPTRAATSILSESQTFKRFPGEIFDWRGRDATPTVCPAPWNQRIISIGDAVFRQDPLSSSGVEKAMRNAWQAATAVHSSISGGQHDVAIEYYERCVRQTVIRHIDWTRGFYENSWCYDQSPYLQSRASHPEQPVKDAFPFLHSIFEEHNRNRSKTKTTTNRKITIAETDAMAALRVFTSTELKYVDATCVINDRLERRRAVDHPGLEGPAAFLDGIDIVRLIEFANDNPIASDLIKRWTHHIAPSTANRLFADMLSSGILILES